VNIGISPFQNFKPI